MSSQGDRSEQEDVLDLIGGNDNQDSDPASGDELQNNADQGQDLEAQEEAEGTAQKVEPPTRKRAKSNVPRLTTDLLKGPKGVHKIEKYFEGFKYYGKGREKEDLDRIMKRMEHWCHRLFPKLNFDDCLAKVEHLGNKRDLQVFLKRYRLDEISADDDFKSSEFVNDDDDDDNQREDATPQEEFDLLLAEQINKQRQNEAATSAAFDNLLEAVNPPTTNKEPEPEMSDEIKERIERNRKLALERKMATLKRLHELEAAKNANNSEDASNANNSEDARNANTLEDASNANSSEDPRNLNNSEDVRNDNEAVTVENNDNTETTEDNINVETNTNVDNNLELNNFETDTNYNNPAPENDNEGNEMLTEDMSINPNEVSKPESQTNNDNLDKDEQHVEDDKMVTTEIDEENQAQNISVPSL